MIPTSRSNATDITPAVAFASAPPKLVSAVDAYAAWQDCPPGPACDALAILLLTVLAERDAFRESLRVSLTETHYQRLIAERLHEQRRQGAA